MSYGPAFRVLQEVRSGSGQAIGRLALPPPQTLGDSRPFIHPAALDGCLQAVAAAVGADPSTSLYLPAAVDRAFVFDAPAGKQLWVLAELRQDAAEGELKADLQLLDQDGRPVFILEGAHLRPAGNAQRPPASATETAVAAFQAESVDRETLLAQLRGYMKGLVVSMLGDREVAFDEKAHLSTLGFDSLMLLDLRARLEKGLGVTLAPTVAWKHPTVEKLSAYLVDELGVSATIRTASTDDHPSRATRQEA
jgi:acyl carrier protein